MSDRRTPAYMTVEEVENGFVIKTDTYRPNQRQIVARDKLALVQIIAGLFGIDFDEAPKKEARDA